jgi:hypothetical protein
METEKTVSEMDERVAEKQQQKAQLEINRDYDSLYALVQKSQILAIQ